MDTPYLARTRCLPHRFLDHFDVQTRSAAVTGDPAMAMAFGGLAVGAGKRNMGTRSFQNRNCVSPTQLAVERAGRGRTAVGSRATLDQREKDKGHGAIKDVGVVRLAGCITLHFPRSRLRSVPSGPPRLGSCTCCRCAVESRFFMLAR